MLPSRHVAASPVAPSTETKVGYGVNHERLGSCHTLRGAVALVKDIQQTLPADKKEVVSRTLEEADKQLRLAEAQFADALGYALTIRRRPCFTWGIAPCARPARPSMSMNARSASETTRASGSGSAQPRQPHERS
jgi:hypothetical protein